MIIVEGWVRVAPSDIERFLPHVQAMVSATRAEPGCIAYAFARDVTEPDLLRISEQWQDEAALHAHFQAPHMTAFNQALAGVSIIAASVNAHSAQHLRTLVKR
jgi:quinol monooxygenase YgiN